MKAKEYYKIYNTENQDKDENWRFIKALRDMVLEIKDIAKTRRVKLDSGMLPIFKEQYLKSRSFIRLVNKNVATSKTGTFRDDALKVMIKQESPDLYEMVFNIT